MKEYIKNIYFIEETQNIEGSYIEVKTPIFIEKCRSSTINRLLRHMPK